MKKFDIKKLLGKKEFLFEEYHSATKLMKLPGKEQLYEDWPDSWKKKYYKAYPRLEEVALPRPRISRRVGLVKTLNERSSEREFSRAKLSLEKLSPLLYYSAGLHNNSRFYPSGGARYPLEIYIVSVNTVLSNGAYHYYPVNHILEKLLTLDSIDPQQAFTPYNRTWASKCSLIIIVTAIFKRSSIKYGERAYRLCLLEAGHLGQNIYLMSAALNLSCCAIAGISDAYFENLLDIEGRNESIVYAFSLGSRKI